MGITRSTKMMGFGGRAPRCPEFNRLCDVADRNGLSVELWTNSASQLSIWVFGPDEMRGASFNKPIVASPHWSGSPEVLAPQLVAMLAQRGYN